ncbi:rhamnan synthesis F family protein, partial [Parabacteroides goldsteinii]|uniref:rhamnan synthesis F family protein n=1 Tax=Parabacteroides goldsteinii TaxID=328812 RepID=UPI00338FE43D
MIQTAHIKVIVVENRGRDVSALLVGCAPYISDYKYVCFVHDKKTTQLKPYCVG